jgi:hypothetical protein
MLANRPNGSRQIGALDRDVQQPATFRHALIDFIADELPRWRDRPDRRAETSETVLTSQLCAHLNSVARHSDGWDILEFRVEERDEHERGRKVDLVAAPSGAAIIIEGRRHVDFDSLMPVECKRLPTPNGADRDEREYVINRHGTTGGIQRFKAGNHGAGHKVGAMIAYIQQETSEFWNTRVAEWVNELIARGEQGWTAKDLLRLEQDDATRQVAILSSSHTREKGLPELELRHLWIQMN